MTRAQKLLRVGFAVHVVLGLLIIVGLLGSPPWVIGVGRFNDVVRSLEDVDWRWWVLVPSVLAWGLPIVAVAALLQARNAGVEVQQVRQLVTTLLQNRQIPIAVNVDAMVPVHVLTPLRIPVELDTRVPIDEPVDIEAALPIRIDLPLDTEIETSVFGIGAIRIPIRGRVPIDLVLPIRGQIRVKSAGLPVKLKDECVVVLPPFEVPIRSRIETRIDLLDNLRIAEKMIRQRLTKDAGAAQGDADGSASADGEEEGPEDPPRPG